MKVRERLKERRVPQRAPERIRDERPAVEIDEIANRLCGGIVLIRDVHGHIEVGVVVDLYLTLAVVEAV